MTTRRVVRAFAAAAALAALATASAARADTLKVAITGIDKELAAAVRANLTASQYTTRTDVSETQVQVLAEDAEKQARQALQPYGYYNANAGSHLEHHGSVWTLDLKVTTGPPTTVDKLDIQIPEDALTLGAVRKAVHAFTPRVGQQMNDAEYEGSKGNIANAFLETGWLDAKATVHRVDVTRADNRAAIQLHYTTGERYKLGAVTFKGSQFQSGFLNRYVPWKPGAWYSQSDLLSLQQALTDADYFSIVDVQPKVGEAVDHVVPVQVEVAPAKRTVYTAGVFYGTDTGPGVRGGIRRRWTNSLGHTLDTQAVLATRLKTVQVVYGIPRPGHDNANFNLGIGYRDENTTTTKSRMFSIAANETREWHGFVRTIGLHALTGTFTVGNRGLRNVGIPGIEHGRTTLLYPEINLTRKVADNPLFVRHGYSISLTARAGPGIDTRFGQVLAHAVWIRALGRSNRLILNGDAGITTVQDFSKLPPQLRFFAGGEFSMRGYGYQAVGPRNSFGFVVGGTRLLVAGATVEHYFTRDWGIAAFVDSGDAFDGDAFHDRNDAGLGLRWRSPIGLVRVDIGVPINNPYYHGPHLNIRIGPDL